MFRFAALPPLSLYIHVPWCLRKCPYCDFNSHALKQTAVPEGAYVDALIRDLESQVPQVWGRTVGSLFIGGGTPSLLEPDALERLLSCVRALVPVAPEAEITLEANPGTAERSRFAGYRAAGVNRLSIGVQSFDDRLLGQLGRIHSGEDARRAMDMARQGGFDNINLDLMFGLPGQSPNRAMSDLEAAVALAPEHLSYYQLTLEPNTPFHRDPPALPDDDALGHHHEQALRELHGSGYLRYEVSAFAREGRRCRHNENYWKFGDYMGIGAGAHGKITDGARQRIVRTRKPRHPREYMDRPTDTLRTALEPHEALLEFMMNALRMTEGFDQALFDRTGLPLETVEPELAEAAGRGLLYRRGTRIEVTGLGQRYLNELLTLFVKERQ